MTFQSLMLVSCASACVQVLVYMCFAPHGSYVPCGFGFLAILGLTKILQKHSTQKRGWDLVHAGMSIAMHTGFFLLLVALHVHIANVKGSRPTLGESFADHRNRNHHHLSACKAINRGLLSLNDALSKKITRRSTAPAAECPVLNATTAPAAECPVRNATTAFRYRVVSLGNVTYTTTKPWLTRQQLPPIDYVLDVEGDRVVPTTPSLFTMVVSLATFSTKVVGFRVMEKLVATEYVDLAATAIAATLVRVNKAAVPTAYESWTKWFMTIGFGCVMTYVRG
jgi:hypothetical protein